MNKESIMSQSKRQQIEHCAAIIKHNRTVLESYRKTLSNLWIKGKADTQEYKQTESMYNRAEKTIDNYTEKLFNLDARLSTTGVLEIY